MLRIVNNSELFFVLYHKPKKEFASFSRNIDPDQPEKDMSKLTRFITMMRLIRRLTVLILFGVVFLVLVEVKDSKQTANRLTQDENLTRFVKEKNLRNHLFEIAGDSYEGRGAGYQGERKAAEYIAKEFKKYGLAAAGGDANGKRTYFQGFEFHPRRPEKPFEILKSRNIAAFIEGADENLRNEIVVIGCHYDGQGKAGQADAGQRPPENGDFTDKIWNSADDNASSVAVLLETARIISEHKLKPKRSVLFIAFGAEEHALNGSAHYVEYPVLKLDRHVAMLNIEKLGRIPDKMPITASGGTSPVWEKVVSTANLKTGMEVKSLIPEIISDTDHYPFAMRKIPAMVIGMAHEEDTHLPSDSPDKISFDKLALRTGFVLTVVLELANTGEEMLFTGDLNREPGFVAVVASEDEIKELGLDTKVGGFKVSMIIQGTPAAKAGLKYGDVIISKNGKRFARKDEDERVFFKEDNQTENSMILEVVREGKVKKLRLRFSK